MLSVEEKSGEAEIRFPKSPARNEGSGSPPSVIFSWRRMRAVEKDKGEFDDDDDEEEEDPISPPLWKSESTMSNPYYPMSYRAQEIARGRQELMKLYEGMPEATYELSLKDLVDQKSEMEKQGSNKNDPDDETQNPKNGFKANNPKKKQASRNGRKKNNYPTSFLLNIFVPSRFTARPHSAPSPSRSLSPKSSRIVRENNDQSSKNSSKQVVKAVHRKYNFLSMLRIWPSKGSEASQPNRFSKVSPKPYSGKDCHSDIADMNGHMDPKLSKNSSRCFKCSGYAVFFKTYCQACGRVYCNNCIKEATEDTPEGRRCKPTCADIERDSKRHRSSCWHISSSNKNKSGRC